MFVCFLVLLGSSRLPAAGIMAFLAPSLPTPSPPRDGISTLSPGFQPCSPCTSRTHNALIPCTLIVLPSMHLWTLKKKQKLNKVDLTICII